MSNFQIKIALFAFMMGATCQTQSYQVVLEQDLYNYVSDHVQNWFWPNNNDQQVLALISNITDTILYSSNYEHHWNWNTFSYDTTYPVDYVQQVMKGASLDFIKELSYWYAQEFTNITTARQISIYVYNHLVTHFSQGGVWGLGTFELYMGNNLRTMVYNLYLQSTRSLSPYSDECDDCYCSCTL